MEVASGLGIVPLTAVQTWVSTWEVFSSFRRCSAKHAVITVAWGAPEQIPTFESVDLLVHSAFFLLITEDLVISEFIRGLIEAMPLIIPLAENGD